MDTIELTNLNRQFLFRESDVGRSKASVAAEFIMKRVPGCRVTPHCCRIQEMDANFYKQFSIIVAGLDNIEARRWLNSFIISLVEIDEEGEIVNVDSIIPIIDGGTEGFSGQARVIIPRITACFECTLKLFPPQKTIQLCTMASKPRNAEHCIAYAYLMEWPRVRPNEKLDADNPDHMQWVCQVAQNRANEFGIEGVTYFKTLGVVKNLIPAVASTNAVISAACTNEAMKFLTMSAQTLNNNYLYVGGNGINSSLFCYERCLEDCCVCGNNSSRRLVFKLDRHCLLSEFIDQLKSDPRLQLVHPALATASTSLYFPKPPALEVQLRPNLDRSLDQLLCPTDEPNHHNALGTTQQYFIYVTDSSLFNVNLELIIEFQ